MDIIIMGRRNIWMHENGKMFKNEWFWWFRGQELARSLFSFPYCLCFCIYISFALHIHIWLSFYGSFGRSVMLKTACLRIAPAPTRTVCCVIRERTQQLLAFLLLSLKKKKRNMLDSVHVVTWSYVSHSRAKCRKRQQSQKETSTIS